MTEVRSARLLAWISAAAAASPVFTCPPNNTTLVKSAVFYNSSAAQLSAILAFNSSGGVTAVYAFNQPIGAGLTVVSTEWVVLNPGDSFYAYASAAGLHVWVSGAVLIGVPPVTPAELQSPVVEATPPEWLMQSIR